MSDSDRVRTHVYVSGHVQGVFYRASTREKARTEGIDGWVKNRTDGRVEAVFEGPKPAVEVMIEWCKTGSRAASVEAVERTTEEPTGLEGFEIRR